jgi:DNA-binding response OmpR family regulator
MLKNLPTPAEGVRILGVCLNQEDQALLLKFFRGTNFNFYFADDVNTACKMLRTARRIPVVLTEAKDGKSNIIWEDVLKASQSALVIVVTRRPDEIFWVKAMSLGAHDVLHSRPFHRFETYRSIVLAWEHWHSRRQS